MMIQQADRRATRLMPYLLVGALSSLGTSWFYQTPELHQKADKLEVVERHDIPKLKADKATAVASAACEHKLNDKLTDVTVQAVVANQVATMPSPMPGDIPVDNCPPPVKIVQK